MPYKDPEDLRQYRERVRVKKRAATRDWERRNPDKVRASQARKRAKAKARRLLLCPIGVTKTQRRAAAAPQAARSRSVRRALDPDEQRIVDIIRVENGRVSGRAMRYHTADLPAAHLRRAMARLRNNGVIEAVGPSTKAAVWTLIPEGRLQ